MSGAKDVDEAILELARSLLHKTKEKPLTLQKIRLQDLPELLVTLFEYITSETIQDLQEPLSQTRDTARVLQTIFDTLEEIMNIPMSHITGLGVVRLDRRQMYDALQIFNDLVQYCQTNEDREIEPANDGFLTLSQLDSSAVHDEGPRDNRAQEQPTKTSTPILSKMLHGGLMIEKDAISVNNSPYKTGRPLYVNENRPAFTTSKTSNPQTAQKGTTRNKNQKYPLPTSRNVRRSSTQAGEQADGKFVSSMHSKRQPFMTSKPRIKSFSSKSHTRQPSVSSRGRTFKSPTRKNQKPTEAKDRVNHHRTRARSRTDILSPTRRGSRNPNAPRLNSVASKAGGVMTSRPRKPSIVSTKIKRHGVKSPGDGVRFKTHSRVKRGDLSPQTVSLCSSLKMLEEFDYLKRRYQEIQSEIEQHMSRVRELQAEEVRIEYVLSHVQQQVYLAKSKKNAQIEREIGAIV